MSSGIPFGNYRLIRRLAAGGMAEVFLATQRGPEGFERTVAVKRILPHLADVPQFVEMFMDEARLAARLSHPNVCHIYEFGKADGSYFIAMEFVDGMDLSAVILDGERNPLPIEHGARVVADTCAALQHAHHLRGPDGNALGIVHRDISPQNILVSFDGTVKVVDFGIAKAAYHINRTRPGVVRGKYTYMSPEQVDGKKLDGRADIFCAGIVLYELATGGMLFSRSDALRAMLQIRDGTIPPPRRRGEPLPAELERIVSKALAHDPDQRYATGAEMQLDLEEFLRGCNPTSNSILLGEYFRKHYRKYHPEPLITPPEAEQLQRGTRAVESGPRGTVAVGKARPGTLAVVGDSVAGQIAESPDELADVISDEISDELADVISDEISDEASVETRVAAPRSGLASPLRPRAAAASGGRQLGPLPIEDPMGLLQGSEVSAEQPPWTAMVVRQQGQPPSGVLSGSGDLSVQSAYGSAAPTLSDATYDGVDESAQTSVEQPDLASVPTLIAPQGRTGPSSGGFRGRRLQHAAPLPPDGSSDERELYDERTHEVEGSAPSGDRWSQSLPGAELLAPRAQQLPPFATTGSLEQAAPGAAHRRRELALAIGLAVLAVAGGVGGYLLADSGSDEGLPDGGVSVVQMARPADLQGLAQAAAPDEAPARAAAAALPPDATPATAAEGQLHIVGVPAGATVAVDGRAIDGETPLQLLLGAGVHSVMVQRAGFEPMTATVRVPPGGRVRHDYRLKRELEPQAVAIRTPAKLRRPPRPKRLQPAIRKRLPEEQQPPQPTGTGYVSVSTIPWCRVYLGARDLGVTPLANVRLPAGQHRLRLVNPTMREQYVNVSVEPERTTKVRLQLSPR